MALFERIKGEFNDLEGLDYTIRIYKDAVSDPGSHTFKVGGAGFIHEYYGDSEELWDWIKYGKVTIPLIVEDATDLGIINEILQGDEGDFYCKITKNSDTDIYFQGIVLIDQASYPNTSYPYEVTLIASDGLSLLQNKRVTSVSDYEDKPFSEWIKESLDQFNFDSFGTFGLWTSFRLWNDYTLTYDNSSVNRDPLVYMYVDPKDLVYSDKRGRRDFLTYGDVLKELCNFLHCNLFYADGKYWFVSLYERLGTTLETSQYESPYQFNNASPPNYDNSASGFTYDGSTSHTFSFSSNNVKPQGGLFRTKPASYKIREPNSAEGSFRTGQLGTSLMFPFEFLPSDTGTGGALNVPETPMVRVADVRQGIEEITIKGEALWIVREEQPYGQNPTKSSVNRSIVWKMRNFFIQKDSSAFSRTYASENVYKASTDTWTTGSDAYVEIELGEVNGTESTYNYSGGFDLAATLNTDNVTTITVNNSSPAGLASVLGSPGWIEVIDDNTVSRWLHYTDFTRTGVLTGTFTIDTTSGDEDFASVNATAGNLVNVVQERETLYRKDFEVTVKSFPSDDNLFWNFIIVGSEYSSNLKAYPDDDYEYLTQPTEQEFETFYHRAEYRVFANQDVDDITDFEFVTVNDNNAGYSYEIILPETKILENDDDFYGNDTNWLKVFPTNSVGTLQTSNPRNAENKWSDTINSGDSLIRTINHERLLEMTAEPYLVLETSFQSNLSFFRRLNWDSKNWIFSSGTFYANEVQWDAVLIQLQNTAATTGNESTVAARISRTGVTSGKYSDSRRVADESKFDYLALTDGDTSSGTTTTIQIRDGKGIRVFDNQTLKIYNPQTGDFQSITVDGEWDGESDLTIDSVSLSVDYPSGSLIQLTGSDQVQYTNTLADKVGNLLAYKTADESISSDTTLNTDTDLQFTLTEDNAVYEVTMHILIDADATPDFKYAIVIPSGATLVMVNDLDGNPGATFSTGTRTVATTGGVTQSVYLKGILIMSTTSGTFGLQWAQNVSSVNTTTLKKGSNIILRKMN